jgi:hypothetical protein
VPPEAATSTGYCVIAVAMETVHDLFSIQKRMKQPILRCWTASAKVACQTTAAEIAA